MKLSPAFALQPGDVVVFVGAGGKTTTMFRLANELAAAGLRIVTTTTTRIARAEMDLAPAHLLLGETPRAPSELPSLLDQHRHVFLFTRPEGTDKVHGIAEDWLDANLATFPSIDVLLVEADGSRRLPLKAPYPHEPALPTSATVVVTVAGMNALGQPLDGEHVYGAELLQARYRLAPGTPVTVDLVATLMADPQIGLKSIPPDARVLALLNQVTPLNLPQAQAIAQRLLAEPRIERVLLGTTGEDEPVWESWQRVSAVILAAGQSERMGQPKLLLPWRGGKTIIRQVCEQVTACAGLHEAIIVTGEWHEALTAQVADLPIKVVHNPRYAEGEMLSSLQAGLGMVDARSEACLVVLGDQPAIEPGVMDQVLNAYARGQGQIVVPTYHGRHGHPVLFGQAFWDALLALPPRSAPRDVLRIHADRVAELAVETPSILQDIDTPEDYRQAKPAE